MNRGQRKLAFIKTTQVKRFVNTNGYQITKGANYAIARHLEHHIEALLRTIAKEQRDTERIKEMHVYDAMEKLYGNDRGDSQ
jgi:hypothetical protein